MNSERWNAIMNWTGQKDEMRLTIAEMDAGWHFCYDWDDLLVGPGMMELACCQCEFDSDHAIHAAKAVEKAKADQEQADALTNGTLLNLLDL